MPPSSPFRWRSIHLIDRSLLIILFLLLAQSVVNVFLPASQEPMVANIDIVVRTTSAGIFGYLLGASFGSIISLPKQKEQTPQMKAMSSEIETEPDSTKTATTPNIQIFVAFFIALFCLITLLVLRNLMELGIFTDLSDSAIATITQFRDYVSSCVGFLIGSPFQSNQSNS